MPNKPRGKLWNVYIDESGDEGMEETSDTEWFVQSACIFRTPTEAALNAEFYEFKQKIGLFFKKPIHSKDLSPEQKIELISKLAPIPFCAISVVVHKPSIVLKRDFADGDRLYFYTVKFLLQRVSWYCKRESRAPLVDGDMEIVFSRRAGFPYGLLDEYLQHLRASGNRFGDFKWEYLKLDQTVALSHGKRHGLQAVDLIAHCTWRAVSPINGRPVEPQYAIQLTGKFFKWRGKIEGYGMKPFPGRILGASLPANLQVLLNAM